jgi:beta-phosphoglucomutase
MANHRGILWDLDGVIVDSTEIHYKAWAKALSKFGITITREKFLSTFGMNNQAIIPTIIDSPSPELVKEIDDLKEIAFREAIPGNVTLLPGVQKWLDQFNKWNFPQAIASSAPWENVIALVEEMKIKRYFAAMVSAGNMKSKPNPEIFLTAAERLDVSPANCVVIEDSPHGIEGARRGGMKSIAVLTTHSAAEMAQADCVVERLDQLSIEQVRQLMSLD